ncbi:MAG TPA: hypothetical protein VGB55_14140, partial [Tepidisphaeraceae bacterium]
PFGPPQTGRPAAALSGGRGNDRIWTLSTTGKRGLNAFTLLGDAGDDYLRSGFTSDTLTGGAGRDIFRSGGGIDVFNKDDDDLA